MQMNFGEKLIELRKQNKMTQEELADKLDVTRQTISNWELNQTKPDMEQLKGISKVYNVSIDELVNNDVKEVLTEKVSNVEKLSGLIYKILKFMIISFIGFIVLMILSIVLFRATTSTTVNTAEILTEIPFTVNGQDYYISIKSSNDFKIIKVDGSADIIELLDLEKYTTTDQVIDKVHEYIKSNSGSVIE